MAAREKIWALSFITDFERANASGELKNYYQSFDSEQLENYAMSMAPKQVPMELQAMMDAGDDQETLNKHLYRYFLYGKNYGQAAKIAARQSARYPHNDWHWHTAAQMYNKVKLFDLALYGHQQAVRLSPKDPDYSMSFSYHYYLSNQLDKSLEWIEKVIEQHPNNKNALQYKNNILNKMKESTKQ